MGRFYRVGEVATLTRISVRTLHHYDRIGLLRPEAHSDAGYRLYGEADLLRLQQVLTLRYLGFPLKRIGELLARPGFDLVASLGIQRQALRDRIAELERIEGAIGAMIERRTATGDWAWELVIEASGAVGDGLAHGGDEMDRLYTPEQLERMARLYAAVPKEEMAAIEAGWTTLLAEVRANHDLDPTDPRAIALADRWDALWERTQRGWQHDTELLDVVGATYERGAFDGDDRAPQAADFAFVERVKAARSSDPRGTTG